VDFYRHVSASKKLLRGAFIARFNWPVETELGSNGVDLSSGSARAVRCQFNKQRGEEKVQKKSTVIGEFAF